MNIRLVATLIAGLLGFVWVGSAQAIPAFARKYEKSCNSCHTAWPMLNKAGRMFKEAGYKFATDKDKSQTIADIKWDQPFFSTILVARPVYQSGASQTVKMRAFHEVEIIGAGRFTDKFSGFFEMEMEDEEITLTDSAGDTVDIPPFNWVLMPHGAITYEINKNAHLQFAWAPPSWADPYDTYAPNRVLTRKPNRVTDALKGSRQTINVYGRAGSLFYNVGIAGAVGEAHNPVVSGTGAAVTTLGRVAFDITNDLMVGGIAVSDPDVAIGSQTGLDVQADIDNTRITAAYLNVPAGNAYHVQAVYVMKTAAGKPTWVPLLSYAKGADDVTHTKVNVGYYFASNAKGFIEAQTTSGSSNTLTLQFAMAF